MKMWDAELLKNAQSRSLVLNDQKIRAWGSEQLEQFLANGFPTKNDENWKYADLRNLSQQKFLNETPNLAPNIDIESYSLQNSYRLVFINGQFSSTYSQLNGLPQGVILTNLSQALKSHEDFVKEKFFSQPKNLNSFAQLNSALMNDGLYLSVPPHIILTKPIHLLYISTQAGGMNYPRHLISLGEGSKAELLEEYVGTNSGLYFNNIYTHITVASRAQFEYYKMQRENLKSFHVSNTFIQQQQDSSVKAAHLNKGGEFSRDDISISLQGAGSNCELIGFYYPQDHQYMDYHTSILHEQNHTSSKQYYKGILSDYGRGVFNGKIIAAANTRQIKAQQENHNLLLSSRAEINTKPELEVYAKDIQCNHGATVGNLDLNALFYLQSRGIQPDIAKNLLITGFGNEIFERMSNLEIAKHLHACTMEFPYAKE